jgi:hypothetical protein
VAGEVGFERVELGAPEAAVAVEPAVELGEALPAQRVEAALAVGRDGDEAGLLQDLEVARHRRLGDAGQHRHEVARGGRALEEPIEQRAAARVGDGGEDVHGRRITIRSYNRQVIHARA